ncbi:unnamed protein product [Allacma fusca]|uniref:NOC3-like protein n=1 Tax=Allacma fusca TaxID=39272 RepID=A0A8J2KV56_9HEXA|nr:unnamed protein product [Allacma fusca]
MGPVDRFEKRYEDQRAEQEKTTKKVRELLPIKTVGGLRSQTEEEEEEELDVDLPVNLLDENGEYEEADEENREEEVEERVQVYNTTTLLANRKQKVSEYKMKIGILAASFLEDPENRMKNLDSLLSMLDLSDPLIALTIPKFAAVSLMAVFIDVLPAYAIKHHTDGVKLKSDTKERQGHEAQLLGKYKIYLQRLEKIVNNKIPRKKPSGVPSEVDLKLGRVALDCMCKMLVHHPHFNMAVNIVNFVVPFLNNWNDESRKIVHDSIKLLFKNDKRGDISFEVVRRINALMKKAAHIRREVLDVLLGLRIKEADLEKEKQQEMTPGKKITFEQRRMLSKKQRKKSKDMVKLEKELLEASAEENKNVKSKFLTEITKLVFTMYFRSLKSDPKPQVLTAVLEGLSKFAHIISIDYFEDLLKLLQTLLKKEAIHENQRLLCVATVLAVLDGHGSALTLDPVIFHRYLYTALANIRCGKPESHAELASRCIRLATGRNKMPGPRAIAFAKRIGTVATQVEHHDALAFLMELKTILRLHPKCKGLLDTDGVGANGVYLPELDDPDHCAAEATTLWELTTLSSHYHPWVRRVVQSVTEVDKVEPLPKEIAQKRSEDISCDLNPYPSMNFTPSPHPRGPPSKRAKTSSYCPKTEYFSEENYFVEFTDQSDSSIDHISFC